MSKSLKFFALASMLTVLTSMNAFAVPGAAFRPNFFRDIPGTTTPMREGRYQLAPMPFVVFCLQYPSECTGGTGNSVVALTPEKFAELDEVNRRVNETIRPQVDTSEGRFWKLDVEVGDCNEFAVQKRHELIKAGWPASSLSLTVAKTVWGEGHLLVTVRTDHGDLVLDSLRRDIVSWDHARYTWIMRQSATDVANWVSIEPTSQQRWRHYHRAAPTRDNDIKPVEASMSSNDARLPEPTTGFLSRL